MNKHNIYFSQSMLTKIANISASTISRLTSKLEMKTVRSEVRKKYDFEEARIILNEIIGKEYDINKKIQVFFNFKGGTGKTTICHQVSIHMALLGFKVLVIDCDPQAHLTYALGILEEEDKLTLYDVIVNKLPIKETIKNIYPGLDIIPSDLSLTRVELPLSQSTNREKILKKIIDPLKKDYDFIFIDTNPTISTLNQNTTYCADVVNIVCETQPFSLKGLEMLVRELKDFSIAMDQVIKYKIIPNKYESKTATSQEVLGSLRHDYKEAVMESIIRRSEDMNISAKKRLPVCAFCKKSSIAFEDICDLSLAILKDSSVKNSL
jgi:chromosome partitioning protein